jgi:hypothetical protein
LAVDGHLADVVEHGSYRWTDHLDLLGAGLKVLFDHHRHRFVAQRIDFSGGGCVSLLISHKVAAILKSRKAEKIQYLVLPSSHQRGICFRDPAS